MEGEGDELWWCSETAAANAGWGMPGLAPPRLARTLAVAVLHALDELPEVEPRLGLVELALRHDLVEQLAARDELQHNEDLRPSQCER